MPRDAAFAACRATVGEEDFCIAFLGVKFGTGWLK